jgi:hypothetical protein
MGGGSGAPKVGDTVEVAGASFTKVSEDPFPPKAEEDVDSATPPTPKQETKPAPSEEIDFTDLLAGF